MDARIWYQERARLIHSSAIASVFGFRAFDIHLVGLDSAWLSGDDNDKGKLLLTTNQVGQLTTDKGELLPGFRLALIHHPLSELADEDDCKRLLADNVELLLRGHLHDEAVETWEDPDRTSRQIAAGCLYEGHHTDEWPNACHVITATLDGQGRPLYYDLRFRTWSKRGHWYDENSLYRGAQNGRLRWWIRRGPPPSTLPLTGVFVGREHELEELEKVLLPAERRPVAICAVNGMPGVGKSYLATRFAELHAQDFPGGFVRLVLNPLTLPSEELPVYERLGDMHSRVTTLGKVADILQARGELDEALRIRTKEQLPVYERLGDVRERAVALFKMATILRAQGRSEEALSIVREKVLPAFERMVAMRELAVTQQLIAEILVGK